nr:uncharacterized protein LOC118680000 [Bactrocera oleae]
MNKNIRDYFLSHGDNNIIVFGWAHARSIGYISSVVTVLKVGKKVTDMLDCLGQNRGLFLSDTSQEW